MLWTDTGNVLLAAYIGSIGQCWHAVFFAEVPMGKRQALYDYIHETSLPAVAAAAVYGGDRLATIDTCRVKALWRSTAVPHTSKSCQHILATYYCLRFSNNAERRSCLLFCFSSDAGL